MTLHPLPTPGLCGVYVCTLRSKRAQGDDDGRGWSGCRSQGVLLESEIGKMCCFCFVVSSGSIELLILKPPSLALRTATYKNSKLCKSERTLASNRSPRSGMHGPEARLPLHTSKLTIKFSLWFNKLVMVSGVARGHPYT